MYLVGYIIGFQILKRRAKSGLFAVSLEAVESFISYLIVGMLLGARLFYVLFYNFSYYQENLIEILYIHHGGLSFHGAAVGMIVACALFARKHKIPFYMATDNLAFAAPPGLFLGRIGNFINAELYGRPTSVSWAMVFPTDSLALPRHPSQLYQALTEGLLLGLLLYIWQRQRRAAGSLRIGEVGALFLMGYGFLRFLTEYTREPDEQLGFIIAELSMGQLLCLAMFIAGCVVLWDVLRRMPPYKAFKARNR
jgi:phosphatidylglycerol:prolipoprotein diacylglycerol transferase